MAKQTFHKNERLCSKTIIDSLFEKGSTLTQTFYLFPFKVFYQFDSSRQGQNPQVLFSVSKRYFKHATDRNLIRRRCREVYRKHKFLFTETPNSQSPAYIAVVFVAKEIVSYEKIEKSLKNILPKISK